jgi:hypothetical protein
MDTLQQICRFSFIAVCAFVGAFLGVVVVGASPAVSREALGLFAVLVILGPVILMLWFMLLSAARSLFGDTH